ncbi:MAG: D-glycero-beta-D-manno-heptose 1,7-bisphosphate 7-phosphatase [Gammaproteobacteria bacterium]|nr:D-glycero-beta-D-manno-heptose 1,7-bisphosphate 7-phosphatase [Gammaproteobacteria bacterium]
MSTTGRLVILDRDGTINRDSPSYIRCASDFQALPGSLEAIARFNQAGWRVAIATNQSGLGRGYFTISDLHDMHKRLHRELAAVGGSIDGIFFCPHTPQDGCQCRKPQPGLLLEVARRFDTALAGVPVIGDSQRDLQAAQTVGARPILVRTGNGSDAESQLNAAGDQVETYDTLAAAADAILSEDE